MRYARGHRCLGVTHLSISVRGSELWPTFVSRRICIGLVYGPTIGLAPGDRFEGAMTRVYEYDVFISYRRIGSDVPGWIRNHFYPRLSEVLDNNLDRDVKIFFDELVPSGATWPTELRTALQRARILLPVCSPKYFVDEWCLAEWKSMELREKLAKGPSAPVGGLVSRDNGQQIVGDAVTALQNLGYPHAVAERTIAQVLRKPDRAASDEVPGLKELVRAALQLLGQEKGA